MDVMDAIYGRSSVRKYKEDSVPEKDIKEILKAGFHAATGMNSQSLRFAVVQNKDAINDLNDKVKTLSLASDRAKNYPERVLSRFNDPDYNVFHKAPALIFLFSAPGATTPVEDGSLAAGNMMLASYAMGYGTCFIGFARVLSDDKEFRKECCVPDDHIYLACISLGKPDGTPDRRPRPDVKILNWIK